MMDMTSMIVAIITSTNVKPYFLCISTVRKYNYRTRREAGMPLFWFVNYLKFSNSSVLVDGGNRSA